jgi:hypothetical protein
MNMKSIPTDIFDLINIVANTCNCKYIITIGFLLGTITKNKNPITNFKQKRLHDNILKLLKTLIKL